MAEVGPMMTSTDVVLLDYGLTEQEQIDAALNILDAVHIRSADGLYGYLFILDSLGLTSDEFNIHQCCDVRFREYMENV